MIVQLGPDFAASRAASLLVVDDSELGRDMLSGFLLPAGFVVTTVSSGREALAMLVDGRFDLVLLDIEMPDMSGLEVLSEIRATRASTELPVIMVTARRQSSDIVAALERGANDYITKPFEFPVVLARIGTHLSLKRAVADLTESEERYALAMNGANDGLWDWNLLTNEVYWSPRWKAVLGYEPGEIGIRPGEWLTRVHPDDIDRVKSSLQAHLASEGGSYESEHRILHRNDTYRWVRCRGSAVRNKHGVPTRLAGSLTDITETKVADALTGLPNRLHFVDLLDRTIKRKRRRPEYHFALLVLGLDRFNVVNDSLGLLTADRLLVAVARRLQASLRATDAIAREEQEFALARLGGDEFMVLLDDIAEVSDAMRVGERLLSGLRKAFDVDGHKVFVSGAIGLAVGTGTYHTAEEILRDAAIALRSAKTTPGNRCELFDEKMRDGVVSRLLLETDLHDAIESDAFSVQYQPIVALPTGEIVAFEALLRWKHPTRGWISPADFIPVAEDTGMLLDMERVTLLEPCRQMRAWQLRFGALAPRFICINVSSRRLEQGDLAADIEEMLGQTGLEPSALKLEITEGALIHDVAAAGQTLAALRRIGAQWSLDDFGTGYSSLSYLHDLPVNTVKVDRSFVSRIGAEPGGTEMVGTIVTLAHNLGIDVVGEGVETAEQIARLRELGCDFAQGFFFSAAVDAASAERMITTQPWRVDRAA